MKTRIYATPAVKGLKEQMRNLNPFKFTTLNIKKSAGDVVSLIT